MRLRPFWLVLLAGIASSPAAGQTSAPVTAPSGLTRCIGLWGTTRSFGPAIHGELTITRRDGEWTASIGGTSAPVRQDGARLEFDLAGKLGAFRGRREADRRIRGHWIQPPGIVTGVAWATPVELSPVNGGWRGTVTPREETITLYVDIRTDADGVVRAVFRNPDGFFSNGKFRMAAEGSHLKFLSVENGEPLLEGEYDSKHDRILLPVPDGAPLPELRTILELTRQSREEAIGYYPRTPAGPAYRYRPPSADSDGWKTADPSAVGLDASRLSALVQKILDTDPRPQTAPLIQGLLVARHGRLVLEEYFYGFDRERPHDLRSGGKTFASVIAGIAIDHGAAFGPRTPVYSMFPEYPAAPLAHSDPRKQTMTLEHLMTMTSGFACDENGEGDQPGNEDNMQSQTEQPDWYKFMLDQPLMAAPGERSAYCSGAVNLIGGIVRNATKTWLPELLERRLARPLGWRGYHLNLTPAGEWYLGGGIHIRPIDALKLGQLYLNGGVWNGRRLVSRGWVDASTAPHPMNAKGTDGYNWHTNQIQLGGRTFREYEANGNGGQLLMVVPEADLVVLITAGNYGNYGVWRKFREELLPQYILGAIRK
jgi:CubicO group peptidase (beta-lactamase class C family)